MRKQLTTLLIEKIAPEPGIQIDIFDTIQRNLVLRASYGGARTWRVMWRERCHNKKGVLGSWPRSEMIGHFPAMSLKQARETAMTFQPTSKTNATETFRQVAESYIQRKVRAERMLTGGEITRLINRHLIPTWENRPLVDLKRSDVSKLLDTIQDQHGPKVADAVLTVVRGIMTWWAGAYGPDDYTPPITKAMRRGGKKQPRTRVLTDDEIRSLWRATSDGGTFSNLIRVLLLTGQRKGKVARMKWTDIKNDLWEIRKVSDREKKTPIRIRLTPQMIEVVNKQPKIGVWVFSATRGAGHFAAWVQYKDALDRKLPGMAPWVIHDLRRTARTLLSGIGVGAETAERVLGHAPGGIEATYNQHQYFAEIDAALLRLSNHVADLVNPPTGSNVIVLRKSE